MINRHDLIKIKEKINNSILVNNIPNHNVEIVAVTKMDVTEVNEYKEMIFEVLEEEIKLHNNQILNEYRDTQG